MRILSLCHAFNSLSQRLFVGLRERGHEVSVAFGINGTVSLRASRSAITRRCRARPRAAA